MEESNPIAQNLPAAEVAVFLRALVGLPPTYVDGAAVTKRSAPRAIDGTAWIAWVLAGLYACALPSPTPGDKDDGEPRRRDPWVPSVRIMMREARHVAVVVAMHRHGGNLSRAATALGMSRRALRDTLKAMRLYPWDGASKDDASADPGASSTTPDPMKGGE